MRNWICLCVVLGVAPVAWGTCGSNTDWVISNPYQDEEFDIWVGGIAGAGTGYVGTTAAIFKIRKDGITLADSDSFGIPGEEDTWSAGADRGSAFPTGAATAEVWCATGGTSFQIGSARSISFPEVE